MKTFGKCKLVPRHTLSHRPIPHSLSQALSTWILAASILLRRKGQVSLTTKRNTDSIEIEKQLKKRLLETFYIQVKRCCSSTARSTEAKINIIQLRLNRRRGAVCRQQVTMQRLHSGSPQIFYNHLHVVSEYFK